MAFVVGPSSGNSDFLIAVNPDKEKEVIEYLKKTEKEIYNTEDFTYTWLTDEVHKLYAQDRQTANIYFVFALIAIIISCLGLFGLSLFDIRQRYREIAIRKVNGAGMKDLYLLLFRKYIKVIGCAFVLAIPLAYYLIYMYTRDFVLKIPVDIGIYLAVLAIISFIGVDGNQKIAVAAAGPYDKCHRFFSFSEMAWVIIVYYSHYRHKFGSTFFHFSFFADTNPKRGFAAYKSIF